MTSYNELCKDPDKFLALTGYTLEEFQAFLPHFRTQRESRIKRRYCDYTNSPLTTIEDKLLFILIYLKQLVLLQKRGVERLGAVGLLSL